MISTADVLTQDLLIEFLCEELPPIDLEKNIAQNFSSGLSLELKNFSYSAWEYFITPRRFGCLIKDLSYLEIQSTRLKKGPAIKQAFDDIGNPTKALLKFANSCHVAYTELTSKSDGYFYYQLIQTQNNIENIIISALHNALKKIVAARNMRWANNEFTFVRPLRGLVLIYGQTVLAPQQKILGLNPRNYTYGHRTMSSGKIIITAAKQYYELMEHKAFVIVKFNQRMQLIRDQLEHQAKNLGLTAIIDQELLMQVTALTEYPVVLTATFNPEYLLIPQECLILSMNKHQKYFALVDINHKLKSQFLVVANTKSTDPQVIINGNEKVLAARLDDAKFFYQRDQIHTFNHFKAKLAKILYHNQLGTVLERGLRIEQIAQQIGFLLNLDQELIQTTASLLKIDLSSEMVGEFPELQGTMGKYYALNHGLNLEIAQAIEEHYLPRFSQDKLPQDYLTIVMALSDKLETLIGIWGIGVIPNGEKDPFALRRNALGVVRILLQHNLNLRTLLTISFNVFKINGYTNLNPQTIEQVYQFILQRLLNYLNNNYDHTIISSVLAKQPCYFTKVISLIEALTQFKTEIHSPDILIINKRIENILKKNNNINAITDIVPALFKHQAEHDLYNYYLTIKPLLEITAKNFAWGEYLTLLAQLRDPLNGFFTEVMVLDQNLNIRNNRINLLRNIDQLLNNHLALGELQ